MHVVNRWIADEAKKRLKEAGFVHISEREEWELETGGKYFFTRNHSTLIAFAIGKKYVILYECFMIFFYCI